MPLNHKKIKSYLLNFPKLFYVILLLIFISSLLVISKSFSDSNTATKVATTNVLNDDKNPTPKSVHNNWLAYNVPSEMKFQSSDRLQPVVDKIVQYSKSKQLPLGKLSITLIDLKTNSQASYQPDVLRYPASVVKLFWLVCINQLISENKIDKYKVAESIDKMILKSDNYGASQILDKVTQTKSALKPLSPSELADWKAKRDRINDFFRQVGYNPQINVSQKTFPIPQEHILEPIGADQQVRGDNPDKPIRNRLTTNDMSRLMYEIVTSRAVDSNYSLHMKKLLTRDINPDYWKKQPPNPIEFNPVQSFFGEGLSPHRKQIDSFVSKAGWTTVSRQEVAYISSADGKSEYILSVIGDDKAYGNDKTIFPKISHMVAQEMLKSDKI
jgi:beta-lactamase class A